MEVVVTFLAMLELVKVRAIRIFQEEMAGPIMIEAAAGMDEAAERVVLDETEEKQAWSVKTSNRFWRVLLFVADGPQSVQRLAEVLDRR